MLVEEAIEKLIRARDTADEQERIELVDEVIEALEEGKIEPAKKYKKVRLVAYKPMQEIEKLGFVEIEGEPIIVGFASDEGDGIAIFEVIEE